MDPPFLRIPEEANLGIVSEKNRSVHLSRAHPFLKNNFNKLVNKIDLKIIN